MSLKNPKYADITILTDSTGAVLACLPNDRCLPDPAKDKYLYLSPVDGGSLLRCGDKILGLAPAGALDDLLSASAVHIGYLTPAGIKVLDETLLIRFELPNPVAQK